MATGNPTPLIPYRMLAALLIAALLGVVACQPKTDGPTARWPRAAVGDHATPARMYAGEVLGYMMKVVLGVAGPLESRRKWRLRGLEVPLDYHEIDTILNDPTSDKTRLMVLDPTILGLSNVLYHYDRRLNQFKGRRVFDSLYPSTELLALRLLMVHKREDGQKIGLSALWRDQELLDSPDATDAARLEAFNLSPEEWRLLKAVMAEEPQFRTYLHHPDIVDALADMKLIDANAGNQRPDADGGQPELTFERISGHVGKSTATVAVLPSLTAAFTWDPQDGPLSRHGFRPTERYIEAVHKVAAQMTTAFGGQDAKPRKGVAVYALMERPLVITPENDREVIARLCPWADAVIILLGKDVYLSLSPPSGGAPSRIYLDIEDARYGMANDEIRQTAATLLSRR